MKTIAAAAVFFALTATAWAEEPESKAAAADEPIVLSEAEMDGVTAGVHFNSAVWLRNGTDHHLNAGGTLSIGSIQINGQSGNDTY